jgi:hypothetical protein
VAVQLTDRAAATDPELNACEPVCGVLALSVTFKV